VTDGEAVKTVLRDHFAGIFRSATEQKRTSQSFDLDSPMLAVKPGIDPIWYNSLMLPFTESEVLALLNDSAWCVAPGADRVSAGLLRAGAERSASIALAL